MVCPSAVSLLAPKTHAEPWLGQIGHNPPMLSISYSLTTRRPKDTRENILATRQFSVNIVNEHLAVPMNATSVWSVRRMWTSGRLRDSGSGQVFVGIKPALVDASSVNFECEVGQTSNLAAQGLIPPQLYHHFDIVPLSETGQANLPPTTTLILGLIQRVHVNESILTPDGSAIDPAKLRAVARLGGTAYAKVNEGFELARPVWKEMRKEMDEAKRGRE
ncbi:uncharacterized protein SCHCODRAFT_02634598 [Schizophyllum commune H4-8]|nr:uncharacterized protein SCHCODRAFT_02634598 [Schizophyllum commune H4-8]KAI5889463.1 hypothetical protein SCHCODRAFT_02634598 [Schizophyllum commune H4-8]